MVSQYLRFPRKFKNRLNTSLVIIMLFLKILQMSQEYTCVGVSFFAKMKAFRPATLLKRDSYTGVFLWNLRNSQEHRKTSAKDCFCVLITSSYIDFYNSLKYAFFIFTTFSALRIKTIELMTCEAVSFEKVFQWTKFLAFES